VIDLQKLAACLNAHTDLDACIDEQHGDGKWLLFFEGRNVFGNEGVMLYAQGTDRANAAACTLIREGLVRDGFDVNHWHLVDGKHFVKAMKADEIMVNKAHEANAATYTEALCAVSMEVWG
jgi:hypothetical protein